MQNVEICPWKIIARTTGATKLVQVFTFLNIHNHSVDDATFGKPVVCSKHGRALIKDLEQQYELHLIYPQAMKEKSKQSIHGCPQLSYKLLPWMCQHLKRIESWDCC